MPVIYKDGKKLGVFTINENSGRLDVQTSDASISAIADGVFGWGTELDRQTGAQLTVWKQFSPGDILYPLYFVQTLQRLGYQIKGEQSTTLT